MTTDARRSAGAPITLGPFIDVAGYGALAFGVGGFGGAAGVGGGGGVAGDEAAPDGDEHVRVILTPLGGGAANDFGMDGAQKRCRG